jgi:transcriptional regulator with GAF, ATPase, and Fis domain
MALRLAVIDGPLAGQVVDLTDHDVSIGRDASNELSLADRLVSRRHATVRSRDGRYVLRDHESHNGSFVNGHPVHERALVHGDLITIGSSQIVFLEHDDSPARAAERPALADPVTFTDVAVRLRPDETTFLRTERISASLPDLVGLARGFQTLLSISMAIASIQDVETLANKLLELLAEAVPADHGAILLVGRKPDEISASFGWRRGVGPSEALCVSRTIVRHAIETGESLLSNDALGSDLLGAAESLRLSGTGSLLVVPLARGPRPLGIVYLGASGATDSFSETHLQLLAAAARVAAPVFEAARHVETLEREKRLLVDEIALRHEMVGESSAMSAVFDFVARVAAHDSTVLVLGESGTGKELVARAVHRLSPRSRKPFVAVNCATLTENLLESELFGHERGAFTGAIGTRKGKFEVADGGTIFLDEIGELSPQLQAKLLRALQQREIERIGGTGTIPIDVRVIAATNRDLESAIAARSFRSDLYYRLDVVSVTVPPLRSRREDVPLLAGYFAARFAQRCKRRVRGVSPEARALLANYAWPGNVRELENAIERAVVLGTSDSIEIADLPEAVRRGGGREEFVARPEPVESLGTPTDGGFHRAMAEFRTRLIRAALERSGGNVTGAARLLGVHRNYVARIAKGVEPAEGEGEGPTTS